MVLVPRQDGTTRLQRDHDLKPSVGSLGINEYTPLVKSRESIMELVVTIGFIGTVTLMVAEMYGFVRSCIDSSRTVSMHRVRCEARTSHAATVFAQRVETDEDRYDAAA
jgi:hypothetical protein